MDFHQHQLQAFFDIPVDHLYAAPVFVEHFGKADLDPLVVVASDVGGAKMARGYARRLGGEIAMIDKRRTAHNVAEVVTVVGDVDGKVEQLVSAGIPIIDGPRDGLRGRVAFTQPAATHGVLIELIRPPEME